MPVKTAAHIAPAVTVTVANTVEVKMDADVGEVEEVVMNSVVAVTVGTAAVTAAPHCVAPNIFQMNRFTVPLAVNELAMQRIRQESAQGKDGQRNVHMSHVATEKRWAHTNDENPGSGREDYKVEGSRKNATKEQEAAPAVKDRAGASRLSSDAYDYFGKRGIDVCSSGIGIITTARCTAHEWCVGVGTPRVVRACGAAVFAIEMLSVRSAGFNIPF
ncbi:MAG: hypothetical protein M1831_007043 [Alyxoria varia]|nr:MAG: hypothetical protein M1831_007043 [Alyxoria varia]